MSDEDETVDIAQEEQPVAKVPYRGVRCDEEKELVKEGGEKKTMNHEGMKQNSQRLNEEVPALASYNIGESISDCCDSAQHSTTLSFIYSSCPTKRANKLIKQSF